MDNKQKNWFSHCFNPSLSTLIIDEMGKNWGFNYFEPYWLRIEFRTKRIKKKIGLNHFKSKNILKKTYLCYLKDFSFYRQQYLSKFKTKIENDWKWEPIVSFHRISMNHYITLISLLYTKSVIVSASEEKQESVYTINHAY